jgi:hypothetical protein
MFVFDRRRTASTVGKAARPDCSKSWSAAATMRARASGLRFLAFFGGRMVR